MSELLKPHYQCLENEGRREANPIKPLAHSKFLAHSKYMLVNASDDGDREGGDDDDDSDDGDGDDNNDVNDHVDHDASGGGCLSCFGKYSKAEGLDIHLSS